MADRSGSGECRVVFTYCCDRTAIDSMSCERESDRSDGRKSRQEAKDDNTKRCPLRSGLYLCTNLSLSVQGVREIREISHFMKRAMRRGSAKLRRRETIRCMAGPGCNGRNGCPAALFCFALTYCVAYSIPKWLLCFLRASAA